MLAGKAIHGITEPYWFEVMKKPDLQLQGLKLLEQESRHD